MAKITVIGGTGYGGEAVVREAQRRGHEVTAVSRKQPNNPVEGVSYVLGSVLDEDVLAAAVADKDVVFEALSPRGDMHGKVEKVFDDLIRLASEHGFRLGVLGGASSLLVEPGGKRLFDVMEVPDDVRAEIQTGLDKLETLQATPENVDWFYVSPAAEFGSWTAAEDTGAYRLSDDVLLTDADGESIISAADLALAIVDEIEQPRYRRRRFHAAT